MRSTTQDYYKLRWIGGHDLCAARSLAVYTRSHAEPPARQVDELVLLDLASGDRKSVV